MLAVVLAVSLAIVALPQATPVKAQGDTWYVDATTGNDSYNGTAPDDAFQTIGYAVATANAYDTIIVYPGYYTENLEIHKSLHLQSSGGANVTTIDGGGGVAVVYMELEYDIVVFEGFTTGNASASIWVGDISYSSLTVSSNNITWNEYGIYFYYNEEPYVCYDSTVLIGPGNIISGNNYGIYFWDICGDSTVTIEENTIENNYSTGIIIDDDVEDSSELVIGPGNTISGNGDGIYIDWVVELSTANISSNNIVGNDNMGVYVKEINGGSVMVSSNNITGNEYGIWAGWMTCGNAMVSSNNITENDYGIYFWDIESNSTVTIEGNTIEDNTVHAGILIGYAVSGSSELLIGPGNTISGNGDGIYIEDVYQSSANITFNNIMENVDYGIEVGEADPWVDATHNWWGDVSGPDDDDGVINGSGDNISTYVHADPWLGEEYALTKSGGTATGTGTAYFSPDSGATENLTAVDEGTLPTAGKPSLSFPHGFFSFRIRGLTPGQTVIVTITLPSSVPVGTQYWKYHASEGGWIEIPMGSDDGDNVITITLVDGGLGDDDGAADGEIIDQGGPGQPPAAPRVAVGVEVYPPNKLDILLPWLGPALVLALAIGGGILVRRRRRADQD